MRGLSTSYAGVSFSFAKHKHISAWKLHFKAWKLHFKAWKFEVCLHRKNSSNELFCLFSPLFFILGVFQFMKISKFMSTQAGNFFSTERS